MRCLDRRIGPVLALGLLGVASGAGCRPEAGKEPLTPALESLREGTYDERYGLEYWTGRLEAREADDEWSRAVAFCVRVDVEAHPNCRPVRLLHTASKVPGFPPPHEGGFAP